MGQLIIHDVDDVVLVQLKRRAWERGLPMQEFLRQLLRSGIQTERVLNPRTIWVSRTPWIVSEDDESDHPCRASEPSVCGAVAG
jgi:plasmid stability protein